MSELSFCESLRAVRESRGLSQAELAAKAGLNATAISHFEAGRRSPSLSNLTRLASALSVTVDSLLGHGEPRSVSPVAQELFRNFERMSLTDQDALSRIAQTLASRQSPDNS